MHPTPTRLPTVWTRTDAHGAVVVVELAAVELHVDIDARGILDAALLDSESGVRLLTVVVGDA